MRKKVKVAQVAISGAQVGKTGKQVSHVVAVDTRGRMFERFSDMPSGEWGQVEPPEEPDDNRATRARKQRSTKR